MKIIELRAENVMRLTAVKVEPDRSLVVISGKNGAGKTSLIDSIAMTIGGKEFVCPKPLRKGAKRGHSFVDLGELRATRYYTAKGGTSLVVTDTEGNRLPSPQAVLSKLVGPLSFDPLAFSRMPPRDQAETLRALVGLDFGDLDAQRAKLYDERRGVNRDVSTAKIRLDGMPRHPDAPKAEISIEALTTELEDADVEVGRREEVEREITAAKGSAENSRRAATILDESIAEWEAKIERDRKTQAIHEEAAQEADASAAKLGADLEATPPPDAGAIRERIVAAQATNTQVREKAARVKETAEWKELIDDSATLSRRIEALDDSKAEQIAAAKMPVDDLGFDESGVTLGGVPFEQASSAEQLAVSVGMGLAMNPKLKLLLIRDGSLLDADNRRLIAEMAEAADAQVWMECVEENESTSVVIVDGAVAGAEAGEAT